MKLLDAMQGVDAQQRDLFKGKRTASAVNVGESRRGKRACCNVAGP